MNEWMRCRHAATEAERWGDIVVNCNYGEYASRRVLLSLYPRHRNAGSTRTGPGVRESGISGDASRCDYLIYQITNKNNLTM